MCYFTPHIREDRRYVGVDKKVLRRIFRLKRQEITDDSRKLHDNKELPNLCSSPDIFRAIRSRRNDRVKCM
jgi:hypothetical protein